MAHLAYSFLKKNTKTQPLRFWHRGLKSLSAIKQRATNALQSVNRPADFSWLFNSLGTRESSCKVCHQKLTDSLHLIPATRVKICDINWSMVTVPRRGANCSILAWCEVCCGVAGAGAVMWMRWLRLYMTVDYLRSVSCKSSDMGVSGCCERMLSNELHDVFNLR